MQRFLPDLAPGLDLLLIARPPLISSTLQATDAALASLLRRAGLIQPHHAA
jgi:RNase P protein component